jgi:hypothetical protein
MVYIQVKNYEHFNKALPNWDTKDGKYIGSKAQYEKELKKGGFEPYDGSGQVERKKYIPSENIKKVLHDVKSLADKKGNIRPTTQLIDKMKSMGVSFNPKFMSNDLKGGIDATH